MTTHRVLCHNCRRPREEGEGWGVVRDTYAGPRYIHKVCPERVCKVRYNTEPGRMGGNYRVCGRDAKEELEGQWLCGIHLAGKRRRMATDDRWDREREASNANHERSKLAVDILKEVGVEAGVHYNHAIRFSDSRYTGNIIIDPADLFRLLGIGVNLPEKRAKEE